MKTNEEKAIELGNNKKLLKQRIMQTRAVLINEIKARFNKAKFDYKNKRLISNDGQLVLQWKIRKDPASPPSYANQQTSSGVVWLIDLSK